MWNQIDRVVDQVVANDTPEQYEMLQELMRRGDTNGVKNLRIVQKEELHQLEANLQPNATAALLAPGNPNPNPNPNPIRPRHCWLQVQQPSPLELALTLAACCSQYTIHGYRQCAECACLW